MYFDLKLPQHVIEERKLSSLQLESVVYACQQHMNILADNTRAGFLVGKVVCVYKGGYCFKGFANKGLFYSPYGKFGA